MKTWSKDQQELTRDILSRVDVVAFSVSLIGKNKGCYLDHLDGRFIVRSGMLFRIGIASSTMRPMRWKGSMRQSMP